MGGIDDIIRSGKFPGVVVKGTSKGNHANPHFREEHLAPNYYGRQTGETAEQVERREAKKVRASRKLAEQTRRKRRGTKRADNEIRHTASVPYGIHEAERRRTGNPDCWRDDRDNLLRRNGLKFDE